MISNKTTSSFSLGCYRCFSHKQYYPVPQSHQGNSLEVVSLVQPQLYTSQGHKLCWFVIVLLMYSFHQSYIHVYLMFGFQYHTDYFFEYLFMNKTTGNFAKYYIFNNIIIYHSEDRILHSWTSPQPSPWGGRKVAVMGGGGGDVIWQNFCRGVQHAYCVKFMPTLSNHGNSIINDM